MYSVQVSACVGSSNQHAMDMDVERETDRSTTANNAYVVYLLATVVLSRLPFACQYSIESQLVIKPI